MTNKNKQPTTLDELKCNPEITIDEEMGYFNAIEDVRDMLQRRMIELQDILCDETLTQESWDLWEAIREELRRIIGKENKA